MSNEKSINPYFKIRIQVKGYEVGIDKLVRDLSKCYYVTRVSTLDKAQAKDDINGWKRQNLEIVRYED